MYSNPFEPLPDSIECIRLVYKHSTYGSKAHHKFTVPEFKYKDLFHIHVIINFIDPMPNIKQCVQISILPKRVIRPFGVTKYNGPPTWPVRNSD